MSRLSYYFTLQSSNSKTGPIPVTTSPRASCAPSCAFLGVGCYGESGPISWFWTKVDNGAPKTISYSEMVAKVAALPLNTFWRHDQVGDLKHSRGRIDSKALSQLVSANLGKRGFTFTHHKTTKHNQTMVRLANQCGFTINLSANNLAHADQLADLGIAPVVVVLPHDHGSAPTVTPDGRKVIVCPATYKEQTTCLTCKLCAVAKRKAIIGFPAHGTRKRAATTASETFISVSSITKRG